MRIPSVTLSDDTESTTTKVLGGLFVLSLLLVVAFAILPTEGANTTEFYVLGQDGTAAGYPENVTVGEQVTLRVGVANQEASRQTYTLVVRTDETEFVSRTITVERDERWEEPVSFAFESTGRKRVQLRLYRGQSTAGRPYRSLRLFVTVRSS